MNFKYKLLGITLIFSLFILYIHLPLLFSKYEEYKRRKEKEKREVAFKNKMKKLEIK